MYSWDIFLHYFKYGAKVHDPTFLLFERTSLNKDDAKFIILELT